MLLDYDYFSFHAMLRFISVIPNMISHESKVDQCGRRGRGGKRFCIEYRI